MTPSADAVHAMSQAEAPPRSNGELVFEAPWESRAFGMAVALAHHGLFAWDEFRRALAEELGRHATADQYWMAWAIALEKVVLERGAIEDEELCSRVLELEQETEHAHDR